MTLISSSLEVGRTGPDRRFARSGRRQRERHPVVGRAGGSTALGMWRLPVAGP
jgi:hypothetical protein